MKVAIVHDDLVQWGGAERVLLAISETFPKAPIYTSVIDQNNLTIKQNFGSKKIITSFMQKIPGWRAMYKALLPIYPLAFEQFDFSQFDLVISQTTRFAKSIITKPETTHICYCHTPARFLWNFSSEKVPQFLRPYLSFLRIYDQISSQRVDLFLAGSENAKKRIKKVYRMDSKVLYPFVDIDRFKNIESFNGGYFLIISRLNSYKKIDIAVEAFNKLGLTLKVVGRGPKFNELVKKSKKNIEFLGAVSETALVSLLSGCKALVITAEEDFGLTSLEAQALGKPVIAYKEGGTLETVTEKTGLFFAEQTGESLVNCLLKFDKMDFKAQDAIENAKNFSKAKFQKRLLELVSTI